MKIEYQKKEKQDECEIFVHSKKTLTKKQECKQTASMKQQ